CRTCEAENRLCRGKRPAATQGSRQRCCSAVTRRPKAISMPSESAPRLAFALDAPKSAGTDRRVTSLSVLVPVYNEQHHVRNSLQRLLLLDTSPDLERVEVIVVDDCSTDRSAGVIERFLAEETGGPKSRIEWTFIRHPRNQGKGRAVQT